MTQCVVLGPSGDVERADHELARHARIGSLLRAFVVHGILILRIRSHIADITVGNGEVPSGERIF